MQGPECPRCGKPSDYGATTNAYPFVCKSCDIRFSNNGRFMHEDWRYMSDPDYACPDCGWSEKTTRETELHNEGTAWQRYCIHLFLKHNIPLPTTIKFDTQGHLIDGE